MNEPSIYTPHMESRGRAWTWIIPAIIILGGILAYAYNHTGNSSTTSNTNQTSATAQSTPQTTTVKNAANLITAPAGTKAELSNIAINQIVSGRIFTIKSGTQTIYTVLSPNVSLPAKTTLQTGQQVALTGALISTNSDQFNNLNLASSERSALANQSLVLLVDQVTISGSNATTNPNTNTLTPSINPNPNKTTP